MIIRPDYINAILPYIDTPLVKILSGVRRCGKSTILKMLEDFLISKGISEDNIILINYASEKYDDISAKEMYSELKDLTAGKGRCYLLLDELQEITGWEKVVNSILEENDTDIYVTGSNSKLMSGEISTYLTGRYVLISVYTLSFAEYLNFKNIEKKDYRKAFNDYIIYGGFPIIGIGSFDTNSAYQIVEGIYDSVITNDISRRHNMRNNELFDRVVKFIVENVGKTFSANSIVNFLKSENRQLSVESVYNYIKWLMEAFVIYPCSRYDIQGKAVLKTQEKYYLSDISIKYSKMGFNPKMIAPMLENIVYLELRRRGYDVYIGKNGTKEIDFIGVMRDEKIYIQVCRSLPDASDREIANLSEIKDHYHKYVVTLDELAGGNENGIQIMHVVDFLLSEKW